MMVEIQWEFIFGVIVLNDLELKFVYLPHILCQLRTDVFFGTIFDRKIFTSKYLDTC